MTVDTKVLADLLLAAEACAGVCGIVPPWIADAIIAARRALGKPEAPGPRTFFDAEPVPMPDSGWSNK